MSESANNKAPIRSTEDNRTIVWSSVTTWMILILVALQLTVLSSLVAAFSVVCTRVFVIYNVLLLGSFFVHLVVITAGVLLWLVVFFGWLYGSQSSVVYNEFFLVPGLSRFRSWLIFVLWIGVIGAASLWLTFHIFEVLEFDHWQVPIIYTRSVGFLTAMFGFRHLLLCIRRTSK